MKIEPIDIQLDLKELTEVFIDIYSKKPWNVKWESTEKASEYLLQITKMPDYVGYCIKLDTKIIGASFGYVKKWYLGDEYFMHEFYVDTVHQKKGFGTKLIDYIKEDLKKRNVHVITLLTNKTFPSYKFYRKNKFKLIKNLRFMHLKIS